jgi:hypothetical protein
MVEPSSFRLDEGYPTTRHNARSNIQFGNPQGSAQVNCRPLRIRYSKQSCHLLSVLTLEMFMRWLLPSMLLGALILLQVPLVSGAGDKDKDKKADGKAETKDKEHILVVPPVGDKEVKLIDYRFTAGTKRLALTEASVKPKTPAGPEYFEFRDDKSTTYKNGIFTYIPLASLRKIAYDREKKTVSVVALNDAGEDVTLNGSTNFANRNRLTIEAEAIIDGLGAASIKYNGGIEKGGLQSVAFPSPKASEKVKGSPSVITADDKEKSKHTAYDVQPVYLVDGEYRIVPYIMFKKTVKVDMHKLAGFRFIPSEDKKKLSTDYEVTLRDGAKHTLSILTAVENDKKKMTLVGLIGRVPVGYKLFSVDAIFEYRAEDAKKE